MQVKDKGYEKLPFIDQYLVSFFENGTVMYNVAVVSLRVVTWAWRRVPAVFCL